MEGSKEYGVLMPAAVVVVGFAVLAAIYSITRHLFTDKTIRLKRQNRAADNQHAVKH
jgi:hypothetical protein